MGFPKNNVNNYTILSFLRDIRIFIHNSWNYFNISKKANTRIKPSVISELINRKKFNNFKSYAKRIILWLVIKI